MKTASEILQPIIIAEPILDDKKRILVHAEKCISAMDEYAQQYKDQTEAMYENSLSMGETNRVMGERLLRYEQALQEIVNNNHKGTVSLNIAINALNNESKP